MVVWVVWLVVGALGVGVVLVWWGAVCRCRTGEEME